MFWGFFPDSLSISHMEGSFVVIITFTVHSFFHSLCAHNFLFIFCFRTTVRSIQQSLQFFRYHENWDYLEDCSIEWWVRFRFQGKYDFKEKELLSGGIWEFRTGLSWLMITGGELWPHEVFDWFLINSLLINSVFYFLRLLVYFCRPFVLLIILRLCEDSCANKGKVANLFFDVFLQRILSWIACFFGVFWMILKTLSGL